MCEWVRGELGKGVRYMRMDVGYRGVVDRQVWDRVQEAEEEGGWGNSTGIVTAMGTTPALYVT